MERRRQDCGGISPTGIEHVSREIQVLVRDSYKEAALHVQRTSRRDGHAKELVERLQGLAPKHRTLSERPTNRKEVHRRRA